MTRMAMRARQSQHWICRNTFYRNLLLKSAEKEKNQLACELNQLRKEHAEAEKLTKMLNSRLVSMASMHTQCEVKFKKLSAHVDALELAMTVESVRVDLQGRIDGAELDETRAAILVKKEESF